MNLDTFMVEDGKYNVGDLVRTSGTRSLNQQTWYGVIVKKLGVTSPKDCSTSYHVQWFTQGLGYDYIAWRDKDLELVSKAQEC